MGETFRDQFLAQGVRKERIEVTGHPLHDAALAQRAANSTENRRELELAFGLPVEARVVLYASQPVLWRAVLTRAELAQNVRAIGEAVSELGPDFWLVIKLHPRESLDDYTSVAESGLPIRLVQQAEIAELIAACEAFISSSSSTVLLAMMLDKPIVTVNFNNVPHFDYYEKVGGTLHVKTREAIGQALRLVLTDEPTRARLAAERTEVLSRYARLDGRATERLAQLVLELCG
jgi:CDP-glycerol glycerophosphotransferase (TagB/SpsB family)